MSTSTKIGLGSAMSTVAALVLVLSLFFGWTEVPPPWDFLLGFVNGIMAGLGATLSIAGLLEHRRGHK